MRATVLKLQGLPAPRIQPSEPAPVLVFRHRVFAVKKNGDLERIVMGPEEVIKQNGRSGYQAFNDFKNQNSKYVVGIDGNVYRKYLNYVLKSGENLFKPRPSDYFYLK